MPTDNSMNAILGHEPDPSMGAVPQGTSPEYASNKAQAEFNEIVSKMKGGKQMPKTSHKVEAPAATASEEPKKRGRKPSTASTKADDGAAESVDISAKDCYKESIKNDDGSVNDYLFAINGKIRSEAAKGNFSTVIHFQVAQNDWVNINRIMDFYRVHGFEVLNFSSGTSPYAQAPVIQYEFTISWANANE